MVSFLTGDPGFDLTFSARGISAVVEGDPVAAAVPIPASFGFLFAALGGLAWGSRRRRAA